MKKTGRIVLALFIVVASYQVNCQTNIEQVTGSWLGTIDVGGMQLRLVFNISITGEKLLEATMDSPDQGAKDIPMGDVSLKGDSLRIEAPMIMGYFNGKIISATTIHGELNQGGRSFEVKLGKQTEQFVLNRPQEPQPPYPYLEEEVVIENIEKGFNLGGTLTIPEGLGPFPAVILVTGSGSQNRDEEIFGHKPFKLVADHLTQQGIAVLRYDDRGVGSSGGSFVGSTSEDNAGDARAAFEFLLQHKDIDQSKVGVIGHSEGGMIAFILAAEYDDIAFIVSLAGPGVDGKTILLEQSDYIRRLSGVGDSILEDNRIVMGKVYEIMIKNDTHEEWGKEVLKFTSVYYAEKGTNDDSQNLLSSIPVQAYAWMRYFVMFDPSASLNSIQCPVLALNGEKDCQVLASRNINAIQTKLNSSGNQDATTMILPGLNHMFQNCETGLPSEYGQIEETFDLKTLDIISDWILQLF